MNKLHAIKIEKPFNFFFSEVFGLGGTTSSKPDYSLKKNLPFNKLLIIALVILLLIGAFYWIKAIVGSFGDNKTSAKTEKTQIAAATATKKINKLFEFPLKDEKGDEVAKLKFSVEDAEIRDEIVVKGQKASSVEGRTFLVINFKITNDYKKSVQVNTRDYIRLIVNNNDKELLAPEIHNDPVEVQAQSTKFTRVAFALNESDKNLKIRVGEPEIDKKTVIELKF